ncbi:FAD:protein FMN transferase [Bifidobacterium myosotis]|uniref:FAD:protein FMN transferase n=1 Tax=Bifidobacterium myosotis TaxID=1630166 RepID=A0A5M9ZIT5_9BIFI|nr:FAD:protein FMN transferase [Bifidobacterium myosotis]KAA8826576.1 FAD:protein FMN transferase [Bifidobacterium myosotis]
MATIQARVIHAMTIPFTVQLVSERRDATYLATLIDEVTPQIGAFLEHVDATFSPFRHDSQVSAARRGDWSGLLRDTRDTHNTCGAQDTHGTRHHGTTISPDGTRHPQSEFAEVYALAQQAKQLTHGHFDPMHAGVYDPTGIVKGWAIERAHERFLMPLIRSGRCDAAALGGGGDIQTAVADDSDFTWRIGVQNPDDPRGTLRTVTMRNGGIATSGTSQRGEHITRTAHDLKQATVIDDHLTFADMWATAAASAGEAAFRNIVAGSPTPASPTAPSPTAQSNLMAVFVRADGTVTELHPSQTGLS